MEKGSESKKLSHWKRCANLAITCNSGETVRQCIFNHANYNLWRVSWEKCVSEACAVLSNLLTTLVVLSYYGFVALRLFYILFLMHAGQ